MTLDELRNALPAAGRYRFLNYAATAPVLRPCSDAMAAVAREATEPMSVHFNDWLARVESTRRAVADLVGARPQEIAFTTNASTALSLIAGSIRWRTGDRVLFPADEFPSNRYVWQNLADAGVVAEEISPEPGVEFATQLAQRDLTGVRLVAFSAVSYRDGRRADVAAVAKLCRTRNVLVAVDAIQAVGAVPVNVHEWDCDFLACGGQKWLLGPVGSGFLYIAARRLPELHVPLVGWASARTAGDFEVKKLAFCDGAQRFEPGLPDVAAIIGLGKSIETLGAAGWPRVFARVAQHNTRLRTGLKAIGLTPLHDGPAATQAGIVTVELPSEESADKVAAECERRQILLTQRRRQIRVAAHATTADADIDGLLDVLGAQRSQIARAELPPVAPKDRPLRTRWRWALVTGASRGLGEGIAVALARRGCNLMLIGRDEDALDAVAERIRREFGIDVEVVVLDLADRTALSQWLTAHQPRLAGIDVLVNNAATAVAETFVGCDLTRLRAAFETNLHTPLTLAQAVLPGMLERGSGAILNVVTSGARCALPVFSGYAASKGALWAWSEALTRELAGNGVTVTTFLPPHMASNTQRQLGRAALAYYEAGRDTSPLASPLVVGEAAVAALAANRSTVVDIGTRLKLAWNALFPAAVARRVARRWIGLNKDMSRHSQDCDWRQR